MAQKIVLVDDIDGTEGAEKFSLGLDGETYEIDVDPKRIKKVRDYLADYVKNGRKVEPEPVVIQPVKKSKSTDPAELAKIREWAKANGHEVSDRGRIPAAIVAAYQDADK